MKDKKGKKNLIKRIILRLLTIAFCTLTVYSFAPLLYFLLTYLFGLSVSALSMFLILSACSLGVFLIASATKCIEIKEDYEITYGSDMEDNALLMRSQLQIVNSRQNTGEKILDDKSLQSDISSKYEYSFDNNYKDVDDDIVIDDLQDMEVSVLFSDESKFRPNVRRRYKGKYLIKNH